MNKSSYKQFISKLIGPAILLFMTGMVIYEFIRNETIYFYRKSPHLLLIAISGAVLAGLLIWTFSLLAFKHKRWIILLGWAAINSLFTVAAIFCSQSFLRLLIESMGSSNIEEFLMLAIVFGLAAIPTALAYLGWRFFIIALKSPEWLEDKMEKIAKGEL